MPLARSIIHDGPSNRNDKSGNLLVIGIELDQSVKRTWRNSILTEEDRHLITVSTASAFQQQLDSLGEMLPGRQAEVFSVRLIEHDCLNEIRSAGLQGAQGHRPEIHFIWSRIDPLVDPDVRRYS
jgi:hypothetical protein